MLQRKVFFQKAIDFVLFNGVGLYMGNPPFFYLPNK